MIKQFWAFIWYEAQYVAKHKKLYAAAFFGVLNACYDAYNNLPDEAKHKFHLALSLVIVKLLMEKREVSGQVKQDLQLEQQTSQALIHTGLNFQQKVESVKTEAVKTEAVKTEAVKKKRKK